MKLINCHNYSCRSYQYSILNAPHVIFESDQIVICCDHKLLSNACMSINFTCCQSAAAVSRRPVFSTLERSGSQAAIRETARTRAFYGFARAKGSLLPPTFTWPPSLLLTEFVRILARFVQLSSLFTLYHACNCCNNLITLLT